MKRERMVGARLSEELIQDLDAIERIEQTDRSTTVRKLLSRAVKDWKIEHYARQYGEGKVTLARASEDAGVTLWEMMEYLRARKISAQYDLSDLRKDLETIAKKD